jgi:predicted DNA binding CopG/RHH family protein
MRIPEALLEAVKAQADRAGMPYQRYIRQALERAIATGRPDLAPK